MIIGKRVDPVQKNSRCLYVGFNNHKMIVLEYSPKLSIFYGDMFKCSSSVNMMIHTQNIDQLIRDHLYNKRIKSLKK